VALDDPWIVQEILAKSFSWAVIQGVTHAFIRYFSQ